MPTKGSRVMGLQLSSPLGAPGQCELRGSWGWSPLPQMPAQSHPQAQLSEVTTGQCQPLLLGSPTLGTMYKGPLQN